MRKLIVTHLALALLAGAALAAPPLPNPDFTKGEKIPDGAKHDWNLGATGARGWMHSHALETSQARQIAVTKVDAGSPAAGVLQPGDVILGVSGKPFSHDPRVEFGKALTNAEAADGTLSLIRWRAGESENVSIKLPALGAYSATAPYDCPKSGKIFKEGCKALAARMASPDYPKSQNAITRPLNALALLASGDLDYLPIVRREVEWASQFTTDGYKTWWYPYAIMLMAEYQMATGDPAFEGGMKRLALEAAKGQSAVGSWGHNFALPNGTLTGYGMMNAPGVPLTISLILARQAGLKDPALDLAIDRSNKLLSFYIGKGAVPYGDHAPWTQNHEDNGKCGMAGVMFNLIGNPKGADYFSRMAVASHGPERDCGHTGNFANILWSMPGVNLAGPEATGAWMQEFGAWYYDLARSWDWRFPHQGPPGPNGDSFRGWDSTGGYLLAYAMPLKKIRFTGKHPSLATRIDAQTAASLLDDGRGWSNNNRYAAYDAMDLPTLLEKLGSWSTTVRERASIAIMRRKGDKPLDALIAMLDSPNPHARLGACEVLKSLRQAAAPAVPKLTSLLDHEDMWIRVKAAEALASAGAPAMEALPKMLEMMARGPTDADPRGMEQRYLCFAIFGTMLKNSIDGVDRDLLRNAVVAGLKNQDGAARGAVGSVYKRLTYEEVKPLLPAILEAINTPSPSGEMFADGVRINGCELLARLHIAEGMAATVNYIRDQNKWASQERTPQLLKILLSYGTHAKALIPELEKIAASFDAGETNFPAHLSKQKAAAVRETIKTIQGLTEAPELIHLQGNQ